MAIVYRHRNPTNYEVFYVGIGKNKNRAFLKANRSIFWTNYFKKHGRIVEIIAEDLSYEEAFELEELLILEYGRRDLGNGSLVNQTNGGEGTPGYTFKMSEEHKKKISNSSIGKVVSKETRDKISLSHKLNPRVFSKESRDKMSKSRKGRKFSEQHKANIGLSQTGSKNHQYKKGHLQTQAKRLILNGVEYPSIAEAHRTTGRGKKYISKHCKFI